MIVKVNDKLNKIYQLVKKKKVNISNEVVDLSFEYQEIDNVKKNIANLLLVKEMLIKIKEAYPKAKVTCTYIKNNNYQLSEAEEKALKDINHTLEQKHNNELRIRKHIELDKSFSFKDVISANRHIYKFINIIDQIDKKQKLSTFEKFMLVYEYVTDHIYKEDETRELLKSSHWIPVVNGDTIVCTGYSSLIGELSSRIFRNDEILILENDVDVYDKRSDELVDAHSNNVIFIKDSKYNITGLYYLDATMDSIENSEEIKGYAHCCIPLCDINNHNIYYFNFRNVYKYDLNGCYEKFFKLKSKKGMFSKFGLFSEFDYDNSYCNDKSSLHYFINNYETLGNQSIIPINAFTNSFIIIGKHKGLEGKKLDLFVNERIDKSIAKTKFFFDCKTSKSCFAKETLKVSKKI